MVVRNDSKATHASRKEPQGDDKQDRYADDAHHGVADSTKSLRRVVNHCALTSQVPTLLFSEG